MTVNSTLALDARVFVRCRRCGRHRELDLKALAAAGHGDAELAALPFACSGEMPDPDGPGIMPCRGRTVMFTFLAPSAPKLDARYTGGEHGKIER
jgi:hypothetical protein